MKWKRDGIFYGWWVTLTAALGLFFSSATIMVFSFSVFLKPLARDFHSNRAAISLAFTIYGLASAFGALICGRLVDRYGPRKVAIPSAIIVALVFLSNHAFSGSLWHLYSFYLLLGLIAPGQGPMAYSYVVTHWCDKHRGLALGLMMAGVGTGAMVMPSVAQWIIARAGWRAAYMAWGAAILLISVPAIAAFLKERPESMGLLPDGEMLPQEIPASKSHDEGLSWREVRRTRVFWVMACAFCLVVTGVQACVVHISALLVDRGSTPQAAALAASFLGGALLIGRICSGYLLDRFFGPLVAVFLFGGAAAGMALLGLNGPRWTAFVAAVLLGLGLGAEVDIIGYLISRYFGLRFFAEIYSYIWSAFVVAQSLGPYLMGLGFEKTRSYVFPLTGFFFAAVLATALMKTVGPYRYGPKTAAAPDAQRQREIAT